jgi:hypothetical protein
VGHFVLKKEAVEGTSAEVVNWFDLFSLGAVFSAESRDRKWF